MPVLEEKKYRVVLLLPPAPPNDFGEMMETKLCGYAGAKLDEAAAKAVLSELEQMGIATAEFEGPLGLKTRGEIQRTEPKWFPGGPSWVASHIHWQV